MTFYYFFKSSSPPPHLSTKLQWQDIYNNFKILRNTQQNHQKLPLKEISHDDKNKQKQNQDLPLKRKSIYQEIGNYFNSPEATILFNPQDDESVEDCLSRRIDFFDDILNNKVDISAIVNKACEIDCQLNVKQHMTIIQRVLYLRMAYFYILATDLKQPISFKVCCENTIKK